MAKLRHAMREGDYVKTCDIGMGFQRAISLTLNKLGL